MKHHKSIRKFGRKTNQRVALLRLLALALISNGKITTTEAKAKELRPFIEKLITKGGAGTLASRRLVISRLGGNTAGAKRLVDEISSRYKERRGGYTRIVKLSPREKDGSKMAIIEFV
ncbi:MAG: 50S ribosomal protein L17 [Patescibacteria group bacterium]|nr:MAG: 50S ribosomal protein L17 [Patescibacteria group bacterium]